MGSPGLRQRSQAPLKRTHSYCLHVRQPYIPQNPQESNHYLPQASQSVQRYIFNTKRLNLLPQLCVTIFSAGQGRPMFTQEAYERPHNDVELGSALCSGCRRVASSSNPHAAATRDSMPLRIQTTRWGCDGGFMLSMHSKKQMVCKCLKTSDAIHLRVRLWLERLDGICDVTN